MHKQIVSPDEFIAEMNRRLPRQYGYKPGLHVFLSPKGSTSATATGYNFEPHDLDCVTAVSLVAGQMEKEFIVQI